MISSLTAFLSVIKTQVLNIRTLYSRFIGTPGRAMFSAGVGQVDIIYDSPLKLSPAIVSNNSEKLLTTAYSSSFEYVFNNWMRISRSASAAQNTTGDRYALVANFDETQTWIYDADEDLIRNNTNSATTIGFVSNGYFDEYVIEGILRSTAPDDDEIGFIIALGYDENGDAQTLEVIRQLRGNYPLVVYKNRSIDNIVIAGSGTGLSWSDGAVGTNSQTDNYNRGPEETPHPWWRDFPDGVKLQVTRLGDVVEIKTSDLFSPETYVSDATITLDLSSDDRLEVFRGARQWGYMAQSQAGSSWEMLQRPVEVDKVYSIADGTLSHWSGTTWNDTMDVPMDAILTPGRLYLNQQAGVMYFYDPDVFQLFDIKL